MSDHQPSHHDAELILKLYDLRREPVMREARALYASLPPTEEGFLSVVANPASKENSYIRQVLGYWEMTAALVVHGTLDFLVNMEKLAEGTQESRERVVRVQARIAARFAAAKSN